MNTTAMRTAYYPDFLIGGEPRSVQCELRIVEANGRRYLKTPFAMVDAHWSDEDELDHATRDGAGWYRNAESCDAYLAHEYPNWKAAAPLMDALSDSIRFYGKMVGEHRIADRCGVSIFGEVFKLARGHKSFTLKTVRAAVKALQTIAA